MITLKSVMLRAISLGLLWSIASVVDAAGVKAKTVGADEVVETVCVPRGGLSELVCPVSMLQLIVNPKMYSGKYIAVVGFLYPSGADSMLFFDERSYRSGDASSALMVDVGYYFKKKHGTTDKLWFAYYRIIAKFEYSPKVIHGFNNPYLVTVGILTNVVDVQVATVPWGLTPAPTE